MSITFKQIQAEDANDLAQLFINNDIPEVTETFTPFPLTRETAHWIACEKHKDRYYLAFIDGKPVGFSMLRGWDEGFSVPSFGIFIDHRYHGKGLGKEMLDLTIKAARNLGVSTIRLSVYAKNPAAHKIYIDRGFNEIERSDVIHNGLPDQRIVMIKDLTQ